MAIKIYLLYQFGDSDYDSVNPDILVAANFDRAVIEAKLLELTAAGYARFHAERNENVRKARWHEGRMPEIKKAVVDLVEIANEAREPEIRAVAVELLASVNQTLLRRTTSGREVQLFINFEDYRVRLRGALSVPDLTHEEYAFGDSGYGQGSCYLAEIEVEGTPPAS